MGLASYDTNCNWRKLVSASETLLCLSPSGTDGLPRIIVVLVVVVKEWNLCKSWIYVLVNTLKLWCDCILAHLVRCLGYEHVLKSISNERLTCGLLCLLRAVVTSDTSSGKYDILHSISVEFLVKYMSWYEQILGVTRLQDVASHHSSSAPRDWLSIDWPTDSFVNQPIDALKTTPCQPSQRVKVYKCYPYSSSRYPNVLKLFSAKSDQTF